MSTNNPIIITIVAEKPTDRGVPYSVHVEGRQVLKRSFCPSFDACRYLVSQGRTGPAEVWAPGERHPRLVIKDIGSAAKLTVSENERHGPRLVPYRSFDQSSLGVAANQNTHPASAA